MLLKIIKFAIKGIEFNAHTTVAVEEVTKRLKRYSFFKAIFGKTQGLVARTRNEYVKFYRLGVPLLILGKPVLYVRMTANVSGTLIYGRFTFPIYSRVFFWLGHLAVITLFGMGLFRIIIAHTNDEPMLWYLYGTLALLTGGMLGFLLYSWYSWTWHNRRNDMAILADALKLVLLEIVPDSADKTQ